MAGICVAGRHVDGWLAQQGHVDLAAGGPAGRQRSAGAAGKAPAGDEPGTVSLFSPESRLHSLEFVPGTDHLIRVPACSEIGPWEAGLETAPPLFSNGRLATLQTGLPRFVHSPAACAGP